MSEFESTATSTSSKNDEITKSIETELINEVNKISINPDDKKTENVDEPSASTTTNKDNIVSH